MKIESEQPLKAVLSHAIIRRFNAKKKNKGFKQMTYAIIDWDSRHFSHIPARMLARGGTLRTEALLEPGAINISISAIQQTKSKYMRKTKPKNTGGREQG